MTARPAHAGISIRGDAQLILQGFERWQGTRRWWSYLCSNCIAVWFTRECVALGRPHVGHWNNWSKYTKWNKSSFNWNETSVACFERLALTWTHYNGRQLINFSWSIELTNKPLPHFGILNKWLAFPLTLLVFKPSVFMVRRSERTFFIVKVLILIICQKLQDIRWQSFRYYNYFYSQNSLNSVRTIAMKVDRTLPSSCSNILEKTPFLIESVYLLFLLMWS